MRWSPIAFLLFAPLLMLSGVTESLHAVQAADRSRSVRQVSPPGRLTLEQVLRAALSRHPRLDAAEARIRAAAGVRRTAGARGNPVLAYQLENARLPGGEPVDMPEEAMLTATFPLEDLYQRGPRVRRGDAEVRATELDSVAERQNLGLEATHVYYRLALMQEQVATARDLGAWLDTLVEYNRSRAQEGAAAEADLLRSQLERDRARAELTMVEVDHARAQADLATFMSDSADALTTVEVAAEAAALQVPIASARSERPEMRAARERIAAADAGITTEHRLVLPGLGAMVGAKQTSGNTSLVLGASMPLPLFNQNGGEVARARAERDTRTAEFAAITRAIGAEVAGAEAAVRLLTARAEELARGTAADPSNYLARADETRRIALAAYEEGAVSLLQVLDAARAWGDARLTFYRVLYAQHESVVTLLVAHGADLLTSLPSTVPQDAPGDPLR